METWEAIRSRRNVRSFTDQPVPGDHLDEILEAGRRAPSSQNWQPWDFVVVTERSRLIELSKVQEGAGHVAGAAAAIAVCTSVLVADSRLRTLYFDLGQATMSMMLAAAGLRIASCHAGVADQGLARMRRRFPAADLVVFGHSHIPLDASGYGLRIFNPGSPTDRRRQPAGTIGVLRIEDGTLAEAAIIPVT